MTTGSIESNVYQRTLDYADELANGYHVILDTEELVTVRWEQVEACAPQVGLRFPRQFVTVTAHIFWNLRSRLLPRTCAP